MTSWLALLKRKEEIFDIYSAIWDDNFLFILLKIVLIFLEFSLLPGSNEQWSSHQGMAQLFCLGGNCHGALFALISACQVTALILLASRVCVCVRSSHSHHYDEDILLPSDNISVSRTRGDWWMSFMTNIANHKEWTNRQLGKQMRRLSSEHLNQQRSQPFSHWIAYPMNYVV